MQVKHLLNPLIMRLTLLTGGAAKVCQVHIPQQKCIQPYMAHGSYIQKEPTL